MNISEIMVLAQQILWANREKIHHLCFSFPVLQSAGLNKTKNNLIVHERGSVFIFEITEKRGPVICTTLTLEGHRVECLKYILMEIFSEN